MQGGNDAQRWAGTQFGGCELGDVRRTRRLVKVMTALAHNGGGNLCAANRGLEAAQEGAYRLVRNPAVKAIAIMESGFAATAARVKACRRLLAIDDTTSLSYRHGVSSALGDVGAPVAMTTRGYQVHSTLLVDAERETTEGLVAQTFWCRDDAERGRKHHRKQRAYEEKESYKWQHNAEAMRARLGGKMRDVVAVSDRESDIFDYLQHKREHGERFIVRAAQDRQLWECNESVSERLSRTDKCGEMEIAVPQRGGRRARQARLALRAVTVDVAPPRPYDDDAEPMMVNLVWAMEENAASDDEALSWVLLTTEAVDSDDAICDILRCYGLRWRIEEFHKAWKSGAGVEEQRHQSHDTLQRMAVMLAFVAVRLLQLREVLDNAAAAEAPCTCVLSEAEWKIRLF
ncbi:MAG: IS4 family transposase [Gammaproteobacteria bacterium]|nr:IS4 family transposase [Gammaproteobacteria bacterium]